MIRASLPDKSSKIIYTHCYVLITRRRADHSFVPRTSLQLKLIVSRTIPYFVLLLLCNNSNHKGRGWHARVALFKSAPKLFDGVTFAGRSISYRSS